MREMAGLPAMADSQYLSTPIPNGVTRPTPVTATLRLFVSGDSSESFAR